MLKTSLITDFTAGEISEKMSGRFDTQLYYKSVSKMYNMFPMAQGGATKRPGTYYLGAAAATSKSRLIPFMISETVGFVLELSNLIIKVWGYSGGAWQVISTGSHIVTTYKTADLDEIQYCQVNNKLYLVHRSYAPQVLTWTGGVSFTIGNLSVSGNTATAWAVSTSYNVDDKVSAGGRIYKCITAGTSASSGTGPSGTGYGITDGTASWMYLADTAPFQSTSNYPGAIAHFNGRMFYASSVNEPQTIWASRPFDYGNFIFFDTITYSVSQIVEYDSWEPSTYYYEGDHVKNLGLVYECVVAGTSDTSGGPSELGSEITDGTVTWKYYGAPDVEQIELSKDVIGEGSAIKIEIASDLNDRIQWLCTGSSLVIGTTTGEWLIDRTISGLNQSASHQTRFGSANIQAKRVNDAILFVQTDKKRLREYYYQDQSASYQSPDLTFWADHLLRDQVAVFAASTMGETGVYCVLSGGKIAFLSYNKMYNSLGWAEWETDGEIESVAVLPTSAGDEVFISVKRGEANYIERLSDPFPEDQEDIHFLDCGQVNTVTGTSVTGLTRFEGEEVSVVVNGEYIGELTVESGGITLPESVTAAKVRTGLTFESYIKTNRVNLAQMQMKRVVNVLLRLYRSMRFLVGYSTNTDRLDSKLKEDGDWYTGDVTVPFQGRYDTDGFVQITSQVPLPLTVLALAPEVDV